MDKCARWGLALDTCIVRKISTLGLRRCLRRTCPALQQPQGGEQSRTTKCVFQKPHIITYYLVTGICLSNMVLTIVQVSNI